MALDGIVGDLWNRVANITEPRYDYNSIKNKTAIAVTPIIIHGIYFIFMSKVYYLFDLYV